MPFSVRLFRVSARFKNRKTMDKVKIGSERVDLQLTLMDSGQCFAWVERDGCFGAVIAGQPVWLSADENGVLAEGGSAEMLRDYLDLHRDYGQIAREYAAIPAARRAMEACPGLRVLNQPAWDALVSFILSANNNVGRIRRLWHALAEHFGERYETEHGTLWALPTPQRLAQCSEAELRAVGTGYRARYLVETAQRVADGFPLDALGQMDYAEAHARLLELPGVGDKVADCVLLFGCRQPSAFPVDVWVDRLLRSWFGVEMKSRRAMAEEARRRFGEHGGILQQFLFHAARTGEISLDEGAAG